MLLLVVGPSGCGKSTLIRFVLTVREDIKYLQTYTTRPSRKHEGNSYSVEYRFVSQNTYTTLRTANQNWDHSEIHGYSYGVSIDTVRSAIKESHLILAVHPSMAMIQDMIHRYKVPMQSIYMDVSATITARRLRARGDAGSISRIALDTKKEEEQCKNFCDVIFTPSGDLSRDQRSFTELVDQLLKAV